MVMAMELRNGSHHDTVGCFFDIGWHRESQLCSFYGSQLVPVFISSLPYLCSVCGTAYKQHTSFCIIQIILIVRKGRGGGRVEGGEEEGGEERREGRRGVRGGEEGGEERREGRRGGRGGEEGGEERREGRRGGRGGEEGGEERREGRRGGRGGEEGGEERREGRRGWRGRRGVRGGGWRGGRIKK